MTHIFGTPFESRWIFDVEIIARYLAQVGPERGLYELPLRRWADVGASKVRPWDFLRAVGEMAVIYRTYRLPRHIDGLLGILSAPFVRYAGAGSIGTVVHYAVLVFLVSLLGVSPTPATAAGALAGAGVNYLLNYHLTFASKRRHRHTLPRFIAVAGLSALLNASGMWYAIHRLHVQYFAAQVICTGLILLLGYVLNRLWTFGIAAETDAD